MGTCIDTQTERHTHNTHRQTLASFVLKSKTQKTKRKEKRWLYRTCFASSGKTFMPTRSFQPNINEMKNRGPMCYRHMHVKDPIAMKKSISFPPLHPREICQVAFPQKDEQPYPPYQVHAVYLSTYHDVRGFHETCQGSRKLPLRFFNFQLPRDL